MMIKENKFSISYEKNSVNSELIIKNNLTNEFVSVLPGSGGRIKELQLNNGKENVSVLKKIETTESENRDDIFTNAKLSPFAGRIRNGQYIFNDIKYTLEMNYPEENNACHGFIYDKKFRVTEGTNNKDFASCTLEYLYNNESKGYPFSYSIALNYKLSAGKGLTCATKITNHSVSEIPISDGWHPYYDLGVPVDELKLKLDNLEFIELDSNLIPEGGKQEYKFFNNPRKIGHRQFDSCFKMHTNGKAETVLISEERNINLVIWQDTGCGKYNYLVIYTPPDRKSIAVEPITSNINSFNNKEGLILLAPGAEFVSRFGIYCSTGISEKKL
jgi:aldose 1-epimerase